jgi:O-antigen/teichoic acid export membrane protein
LAHQGRKSVAFGASWGALVARLRGRPVLQAVLTNSGWLLIDRLLRVLFAVLVGAWVARHLGPVDYGQLAYVLALLALLQSACALGLDGIVVRELAQRPASTARLLGSALRMRLVAALTGWLLAMSVVAVTRPGDDAALLMTAIVGCSLMFQASDVVDLWLQSRSNSGAAVPAKALSYCGVALVRVALIVLDAPLWAFAAAVALDVAAVAAALAWTYWRQRQAAPAWSWDRSLALGMLKDSWPLMVSALSIGIYMRIDQLMLRSLASERELGLYSAVLPFSQLWHMVPMTLCASLLAPLARLSTESPGIYRRRLQQLFSIMAWAGMAAAALTALCAPWLVAWLLGAQYLESVGVLRWHVVTNVFIFLGVAQSVSIINDRSSHLMLAQTAFGAVVSVSLNFALIPRWGAIGAAWSAIAAQSCSTMLANLFIAPRVFAMQLRAFVPFNPTTILGRA